MTRRPWFPLLLLLTACGDDDGGTGPVCGVLPGAWAEGEAIRLDDGHQGLA